MKTVSVRAGARPEKEVKNDINVVSENDAYKKRD